MMGEEREGGDLWSLSERYGEIPLGLGLARMEGGRLQEEGGGQWGRLVEAAWDSDIEVLEAVGEGGGGMKEDEGGVKGKIVRLTKKGNNGIGDLKNLNKSEE